MREEAPKLVGPGHSDVGPLDARRLCDLYAERVYRFAAMVSDGTEEAEDLAQDSLERAIRAIGKYDPNRGAPEAWLWRIVVNAARDRGRIYRRQRMLFERLVILAPRPPYPWVVEEIDSAVSDKDLLDAVRNLPPRARALIALRFGADLDFAAVGAALGMSSQAAGVATRRALASLRGLLGPARRTV